MCLYQHKDIYIEKKYLSKNRRFREKKLIAIIKM